VTLANDPASNVKRGATIVIPGAVGQRVEWTGIHSGLAQREEPVGLEIGGKLEFRISTWAVAQVKVYPAIRVRHKDCEIVGDTLVFSIPDPELPQWKRLNSGAAVRVSLELGLKNYRPGPEPSPLSATISPPSSGVCKLNLIFTDSKLLESW
jgi:hypothetical protein